MCERARAEGAARRGASGVLCFVLGIAAALWGLMPAPAGSQECPRSRSRLPQTIPAPSEPFNPVPADGDLELPMPCGAKMVLRHVCVPAAGLLGDLPFEPGCINCGSSERRFMEERRQAAISGPFLLADLPGKWRALLTELARSGDGYCPGPEAGAFTGLYYFIGKYEVTNFQWQAVMEEHCPGEVRPLNSEDPRPKTGVSWFDAVEFSRRYTQWLVHNAPDSLPVFSGGRFAYLRLPTEEEWEFAARGGHMVPESFMGSNDFFPLDGRSIHDFAVFTDTAAAKPPETLAWIGSKCPNPLGLYDTAGNAAEIVFDLFRYTTGWRLHGSAGGFVAKGGSYLKDQNGIMPGRREEMPFYIDDGPFGARDLGFRLALSGIVTPADHAQALEESWQAVSRQFPQAPPGAPPPPRADDAPPPRDPMAVLEALSAGVPDDARKADITFLRDLIKSNGMQLAVQTAQAARGVVLSGIYTAESVSGYAIRRKTLASELTRLERLKEEAISESLRDIFEAGIATAQENVTLRRRRAAPFTAPAGARNASRRATAGGWASSRSWCSARGSGTGSWKPTTPTRSRARPSPRGWPPCAGTGSARSWRGPRPSRK